ncbi:MAG: hypothetical protein RI897_3090 [Verrucomicrobiota bacterium]
MCPGGVFEEVADLVIEFVAAPFRVVIATAVGVADGDDLDIGVLEGGDELAEALGAAADEADLDASIGGLGGGGLGGGV